MLVRYFRRPSRIEQLRSSTGGHLLEGFAKELSQGCYQWVAARKHIRAAEHFIHWMGHRGLSITAIEERFAQVFALAKKSGFS
jgi:integrase/recombinase XerD